MLSEVLTNTIKHKTYKKYFSIITITSLLASCSLVMEIGSNTLASNSVTERRNLKHPDNYKTPHSKYIKCQWCSLCRPYLMNQHQYSPYNNYGKSNTNCHFHFNR